MRQHVVNRDRIGDVLNLAIPKALIGTDQLVLDVFIDGTRDVNAARLRQPFQPCGDVHAFTVNVIVLDDDVAEVDADTILTPLRPGQLKVATDHPLLNHNCRSDRLHRRLERRSVAAGLDDSPMVFSNGRENDFPHEPPYARVRPPFVSVHQSGIAGDIGSKHHS
jgi:hypothetical protein